MWQTDRHVEKKMNTHKIEINFKINEILAVDSSKDIFKTMKLKWCGNFTETKCKNKE